MIGVSKREKLVSSIKRLAAAVKKAVAESAKAFVFDSSGSMTKNCSYASAGSVLISFFIKPQANYNNTNIFGIEGIGYSYPNFRVWIDRAGKTVYLTMYIPGVGTKELSVPVTSGQLNHVLIYVPASSSVNLGYASIQSNKGASQAVDVFNTTGMNFTNGKVVVGSWTLDWSSTHALDSAVSEIAVWFGATSVATDGNLYPNDFSQFITTDGKPRTDLAASAYGQPTFWIKGDAETVTKDSGTDGADFTLTGSASDVAI